MVTATKETTKLIKYKQYKRAMGRSAYIPDMVKYTGETDVRRDAATKIDHDN